MKRIQIKWYKAYNVIIFAILGILGFTVLSCSKEKEHDGVRPMYGVSSANYIIQETATDSQTEQQDTQEKASWETIYTNSNE